MKELIVPFTDDEFAFHMKHYGEYKELIRCRDCKYYILDDKGQMACDFDELLRWPEDYYCASAERRDEQ